MLPRRAPRYIRVESARDVLRRLLTMKHRRTARWEGTEEAVEVSRKRSRERTHDEIPQELIEEWKQMFTERELAALRAGVEAIRSFPSVEQVKTLTELFTDTSLTEREAGVIQAKVEWIKGATR
jgi:negative regulator of replication initiation